MGEENHRLTDEPSNLSKIFGCDFDDYDLTPRVTAQAFLESRLPPTQQESVVEKVYSLIIRLYNKDK